jgi:predicted nucleic acid-binding protein
MKYIVDANVLSEPTKPRPHGGAIAWLREHESEIAIEREGVVQSARHVPPRRRAAGRD